VESFSTRSGKLFVIFQGCITDFPVRAMALAAVNDSKWGRGQLYTIEYFKDLK
jgi:hypothetical protein